MATRKKNVAKRRPAEAGGVASYVALLIGYIAGVDDPGVLVALAGVVGFVPAAITWIVGVARG